MLISIIIVNWNRIDDMRETLKSLESQTYRNYEIVVVDNGSTDGSENKLPLEFPKIHLISLDENLGCEEGFNIGMENSNGDIFFYLDSDASLDNDVLEKTAKEFLENKNLGILDPRIINPHSSQIINEPKYWPKKNHFTGCAAAIRRSVIDEIGMRPSEYFIYTSEPDICLRTINAGFEIKHFSSIVAYHRESPTKRLSKKFFYYFTRNGLWLIWKFYPVLPAIKETFFHLLFNFYKSLTSSSLNFFFKGLFEGIYGIKEHALSKRNPILRYDEARLYPKLPTLLQILKNKFMDRLKKI